jgi:hypothetical protein
MMAGMDTGILYAVFGIPLLILLFFLPFWFPLVFWLWHREYKKKLSWTGVIVFYLVEIIGLAFFVWVCIVSQYA